MLLDLALVTTTLVNLIRNHLSTSPEAATIGGTFSVSPLSPDRLTGERTIGLYLYHINEDAHFKNQPPRSADVPPIRYTPMGLDLSYMLTARSELPGDPAGLMEQTLIGLAMKALHDYPVIDDTTAINGIHIFPAGLQGTDNRFRISLQPIQHAEAPSYWTAGSQALRLAVYYQASVVFLEPERPTSRAGRVLTYGVFTFTRGAPHLDGSRSTVTFTLPTETTPRTVEARPAEAPVGGQLTFFGTDLAGDQTTLLLKHPRFRDVVEVGTEWGVVASANEIFATVQARAGSETIVPGLYSALAKVVERRLMPDGTTREFGKTSNEAAFVVAPRITAILAPDAQRRVAVQGGVFQDAAIEPDGVEVYIGGQALPAKKGASVAPGEFEIVDASTLRYRYPIVGVSAGDVVPFRVLVNGAESAPIWVTAA